MKMRPVATFRRVYGHPFLAALLTGLLGMSFLQTVSGQEPPDGLSGLAATDSSERGGEVSERELWAVAEDERDLLPVRVVEEEGVRFVELQPGQRRIAGVPQTAGTDQDTELEALAYLGNGCWGFGTEKGGPHRVLLGEEEGGRITIRTVEDFPYDQWATATWSPAKDSDATNSGVEGLCYADPYLLAVSERIGEIEGERFAPLAVYKPRGCQGLDLKATGRIPMPADGTSLSSLACRDLGKSLDTLAISRHRDGEGSDQRGSILRFSVSKEKPGDPQDFPGCIQLPPDPVANWEGIEWHGDSGAIVTEDNKVGGDDPDNRPRSRALLLTELPPSADEDANACTVPNLDPVRIPLNATGFADFRFLNPRSPFQLIPPREGGKLREEVYRNCLEQVRITFENQTSSRSFILTVPFKIRSSEKLEEDLVDEIEELSQTLLILRTSSQDPESDAAGSQVQAADASAQARQEFEQAAREFSSSLRKSSAELRERAPVQDKDDDDRGRVGKILNTAREVFKQAGPFSCEPLVADQRRRLGKLIEEVKQAMESDPQCGKPDESGFRPCSRQIAVPPGIDFPLVQDDWLRILDSADEVLEMQVAFFDEEGKPSNATAYIRTVPEPSEPASRTTWSMTGLVGYSRDPVLDSAPETTDKSDPFSSQEPYAGDEKRRFPALGRIDLEQTLGNRAKATAQLGFKSGDLGESDSTNDVTVSQYRVDIFGKSGVALRFGKYAVAAPSNSIATSESGEAFELILPQWSGVSISHLIKRESLTGVANDADQDSSVWILQGRNFPINGPFLRNASFLALYGEENDEQKSPSTYDYLTVGGELSFGRSKGFDRTIKSLRADAADAKEKIWSFSGTVAAYRSDRDVQSRDLEALTSSRCEGEDIQCVANGEGTVGLLTAQWSRILIEKTKGKLMTKPQRSVQVLVGFGTGDDPDSEEDEGYLGETAGFTPDKLFLKSFSKALDTADDVGVRPGLSNKLYLGLAYTERTWSLLQHPIKWLAKWFSSEDTIVSRSSTFKLHRYQFDEKVLGSRGAGWEWGVDFEVQVPKGVKTTLGFGQFYPDGGLEELFRDDPFIVTTAVSVTLK